MKFRLNKFCFPELDAHFNDVLISFILHVRRKQNVLLRSTIMHAGRVPQFNE